MSFPGPTAENDPIIKELEKARKFSIVKFHENNLIFNQSLHLWKGQTLIFEIRFLFEEEKISFLKAKLGERL